MLVSECKRYEYWNHFLAQAAIGEIDLPHGITKAKLRKCKHSIIDDDHFWRDVILRHNGNEMTPEMMSRDASAVYDHCRGNFWGMLAAIDNQ